MISKPVFESILLENHLDLSIKSVTKEYIVAHHQAGHNFRFFFNPLSKSELIPYNKGLLLTQEGEV
jgi:hypothetical protein